MWCKKGLLKKQEAGRLVVTQSTRTPSVKTAWPLCNQFCHVPETATQTSKSFQFLRDLAKNESCTVAFSSYFESRCWTKENWKPLLHAQQLLRLKTHQLEAGWLRYDWVPTSPTILKTADSLLLAEVTLFCGTHIKLKKLPSYELEDCGADMTQITKVLELPIKSQRLPGLNNGTNAAWLQERSCRWCA